MIAVVVRCQVTNTTGSMIAVTTRKKIAAPPASPLPVASQTTPAIRLATSGNTNVALWNQDAS